MHSAPKPKPIRPTSGKDGLRLRIRQIFSIGGLPSWYPEKQDGLCFLKRAMLSPATHMWRVAKSDASPFTLRNPPKVGKLLVIVAFLCISKCCAPRCRFFESRRLAFHTLVSVCKVGIRQKGSTWQPTIHFCLIQRQHASSRVRPHSPYGRSKTMLQDVKVRSDLYIGSNTLTNPYGLPGPSGSQGQVALSRPPEPSY